MPRLFVPILSSLLVGHAFGNTLVDELRQPSKEAAIAGFFFEIASKCDATSDFLAELRSRQRSALLKGAVESGRVDPAFEAQFELGRDEARSMWSDPKFQKQSRVVTCKTVQAVVNGTFRSPPAFAAKPSNTAYNALWNDSGPAGAIGFWLYESSGQCPSLRTANPSVVAIAPLDEIAGNSSESAPSSVFSYCLLFGNDKSFTQCSEGRITYKYIAEAHEYVGSYHVRFPDGSIRTGDFTAQYCPDGK
jgi:hypothetical protein